MRISKTAAIVFLSLVACTAYAEHEQVWSHSTLTGEAAKERFLSDSSECMGFAAAMLPSPQYPSVASASGSPDLSGFREATQTAKQQQIQMAFSCMSVRGWTGSVNRSH